MLHTLSEKIAGNMPIFKQPQYRTGKRGFFRFSRWLFRSIVPEKFVVRIAAGILDHIRTAKRRNNRSRNISLHHKAANIIWILFTVLFNNLLRAIAGAIITYDDFQFHVLLKGILLQTALYRFWQIFLFIIGNNNEQYLHFLDTFRCKI